MSFYSLYRNSFAADNKFCIKLHRKYWKLKIVMSEIENNDAYGFLEDMVVERVYPSDFTPRKAKHPQA